MWGAPRPSSSGPTATSTSADGAKDRILRYDGQTGDLIDRFVKAGAGGLDDPHAMTFGPDGNLYVASFAQHPVLQYDGRSGQFLGVFVQANSGGLTNPHGLCASVRTATCT